MRPRLITAENRVQEPAIHGALTASMRPRLITAENALGLGEIAVQVS